MEEQIKQEVIQLPESARKTINEIRAQMISLQTQLQQFVDGVLVGMGFDVDQHPTVDLDAMTITFEKKEAENASES